MSKEIDDHILQFYQPKKILGSGAYGHVWRVIERRTKKEFALKKIFDAFQNSTDAQRTYRQISVLSELDHPNIIKLFKVLKAKNNKDLYLVFEYMEADLHSLIGESILQSVHTRFVIYQILKSIKYLHSAQLLHRDLKPSNILINSQCEIKICDFGLARSLTRQENEEIILSQEVATRWYRSPEMLLSSRRYSKPTDVWSIGCIIAEILMGKPIFPGSSTLNQLQKIIEFTGIPSKESIDSLQSEVAQNLINQLTVRKRSVKDYFKNCEPEIVSLLSKMLEFNPSKRISIEQALSSPILAEFRKKEQEHQFICSKFIVPNIDDNVKLTMQKYRQMIYRDIDRRYPDQNDLSKNERENTSLTKKKKYSYDSFKRDGSSQKNFLKRQKSMIQVNKNSNVINTIINKVNITPYKQILSDQINLKRSPPKQHKKMLQKVKSKKNLIKSKATSKKWTDLVPKKQ